MPLEHPIEETIGCICIIVDVISNFSLSLQSVMKGSFLVNQMNAPLAWEALYVPSVSDERDPNKAPTEMAPSSPEEEQRQMHSIP